MSKQNNLPTTSGRSDTFSCRSDHFSLCDLKSCNNLSTTISSYYTFSANSIYHIMINYFSIMIKYC